MHDSGDTGGRGHGTGEAGPHDLQCPTCGHAFGPSARAPMVEPIPERRPLLWLRVVSAVVGGALALGGSAYGAYRFGAARAGGPGPQPLSEASLVSTDTSAPTVPATSTPDASSSAVPPSWLPTSTAPSSEESSSTGLGSSGGSFKVPPGMLDGLSGGRSGGSGSGGSSPGSGSGSGGMDLAARARLSASSTLAPAHGCTYIPGNLVDGRKDTCWAEGVPGYGIGQSVTLDFVRQATVTRIEVLPGYDKYNQVDRWRSNGRLKTATVRFDDGTTQTLRFTDTRSVQSVSVPSRTTRKMTLTITEAYPAVPGPHSAEDTSIGELHVYGR